MNIKRMFALAACIMLFAANTSSVFADSSSSVSVCVNGSFIAFDDGADVFILNGDTAMVPVRKLCEALNASIVWEPESSSVFISKGNISLAFQTGTTDMFKSENSKSALIEKNMQTILTHNTLTVPVRCVANALGADVSWDSAGSTVIIVSN